MASHCIFRATLILFSTFISASGLLGDGTESAAATQPKEIAPQDIYLEFKLVRIPEQALATIATKLGKPLSPGIIDASYIPLLLADGSLSTIGGGSIRVTNGVEGVIRMITERRFPVEWADGTALNSDSKTDSPSNNEGETKPRPIKKREAAGADGLTCIPSFGASTDLGVILKVTPVVIDAGKAVTFQFNPVCQALIGESCYSDELPFMKMPVVEARTVESKCTLHDGEMAVVATSSPSGEDKGKWRELFLMTAKIFPNECLMANSPGTVFANAVRFIQIDEKELNVLNGGKSQFGFPDNELVHKLLASGKAELIYNGQVLSEVGKDSISRDVHEMSFPEDLTVKDAKGDSYSLPTFKEPTCIGMRFEVTAEPPSLHLNPQLVSFNGWDAFPFLVTGKSHIVKQPRIMRTDINTVINLRKVEFMPIAKMEEGGRVVFVLLSSSQVSADGKTQ